MEPRRFIGLMSGTSCDGVDAALVEIRGRGLEMSVRFVLLERVAYPSDLRHELLGLMAPAATRSEVLARAHMRVGSVFAGCAARLVERSGVPSRSIEAIGSHGQTVCHLPPVPGSDEEGATLQIGEPALIAARTGIMTVADFRVSDVALGGQGAPLVPWTDFVLFRSETGSRVVLNLGGIANLTHLPAGGGPETVRAFDTGPGCMLLDELARRITREPDAVDRDGAMSADGTPDESVVGELLDHPFFRQAPPRSAGREQFGRGFADRAVAAMDRRELDGADRMATAARVTARSVADAIRRHLGDADSGEVFLCGGGSRNRTLAAMLGDELRGATIRTVDELGIPAEAKECVSFAMMAAACIDGVAANLPQVTGARRPCVLGKIVPAG